MGDLVSAVVQEEDCDTSDSEGVNPFHIAEGHSDFDRIRQPASDDIAIDRQEVEAQISSEDSLMPSDPRGEGATMEDTVPWAHFGPRAGLPGVMSQPASATGVTWEVDVGVWQGIDPSPPSMPKKGLKGKKKRVSRLGRSIATQRKESGEDREGSGKAHSGASTSLPDITADQGVSQDPKEDDEDESEFGDDMAIDYVPPKNHATVDLMAQRKFMDLKKWYCISRPQYSKSCGISSLVSSWNYLFSKLGAGSLKPITQEEALTILDFKPPFGQIRFGPFTGNQTLMRWFKQLNDHYGVRGRGFFLYKPIGRNKTVGVKGDQALKNLKESLRRDDTAIIYHCLNHYFCPIGYEVVPRKAWDAYSCDIPEKDATTWILVGDPSRKHPAMHCIKWDDIEQDLNLQMPEFLDVRRLHKGVQKRNTAKKSGNMHCLMAFQRSKFQGIRRNSQRTIQKTRSDENRVKTTVFKSKPAGKKKLLKSDSESEIRLPPIDGASNIPSDEDDEMKHWVNSGALTTYVVSDLQNDGNSFPQGDCDMQSFSEHDVSVSNGASERRLENDNFPRATSDTCVKSVMNLSIGGASCGVSDTGGSTVHMETESDCMSGEELAESNDGD